MAADRTITKNRKVEYVDELSGTSTIELVEAVAGKIIWVHGGELTFSAGSQHQLLSSATPISGKKTFPGAGVWNLEEGFEYRTAVGEALNLSRSIATTVQGEVLFSLIDG